MKLSLFNKRLDPEKPSPLKHIWRQLYCLGCMLQSKHLWGKTDAQHIDAGYCLDRYSLIEAKTR